MNTYVPIFLPYAVRPTQKLDKGVLANENVYDQPYPVISPFFLAEKAISQTGISGIGVGASLHVETIAPIQRADGTFIYAIKVVCADQKVAGIGLSSNALSTPESVQGTVTIFNPQAASVTVTTRIASPDSAPQSREIAPLSAFTLSCETRTLPATAFFILSPAEIVVKVMHRMKASELALTTDLTPPLSDSEEILTILRDIEFLLQSNADLSTILTILGDLEVTLQNIEFLLQSS